MTIDEQVCNALAAHLDRETEDDGREAWEPITFKVGQRVRVHLSRECRLRGAPGSFYDRAGQVGHPEYEDGLVGTVTNFGNPRSDFLAAQGHTVDVFYDVDARPEIAPGRWSAGGTYALSELVPLTDADAPSQPRGDEGER